MKRLHNQRGFTIVELMIATAVFSVVLLLCAAGLIEVGRSYTRGVIASRTQEAARNALDTISQTLQLTNGELGYASGGVQAYCIGNQQFSFVTDQKLVSGAPGAGEASNALVAHTLTAGCPSPTPADITNPAYSGGQELLAENMQLANLSIVDNGETYTVNLRIVYGDDDFFIGDLITSSCRPEAGSEYCATVDLTTVVQKRI